MGELKILTLDSPFSSLGWLLIDSDGESQIQGVDTNGWNNQELTLFL